jgi:ubiquitin C-terminal hydrolase
VEYPLYDLDLRHHISEKVVSESENKDEDFLYNLYGVIIHKGGLNHGHYISYCKNYFNQNWYLYDDELVKEEPNVEGNVLNQNAYILFYRKKALDAPEKPKQKS